MQVRAALRIPGSCPLPGILTIRFTTDLEQDLRMILGRLTIISYEIMRDVAEVDGLVTRLWRKAMRSIFAVAQKAEYGTKICGQKTGFIRKRGK